MIKEELICAPVSATEEETWAAAEGIARIAGSNSPFRHSLNIISNNGHYIKEMIRSIKTGWAHDHKPTTVIPEITLCGKWLQRTGFNPDDRIWVLPLSELLIVIPQKPKTVPKSR
ncbi:hypothetical protein [Niastella populi]|uniref:Toxin SymE-like domain-containing protein n=1 Tax=Niastella populi TaxID=550983 RepID=A0A1V9FTA1_9BACT|nr:hypothetical protein [Niastella populi]OQP61573.1 hypothetical protein A4R26_18570 [Niastella populi]